MVLVNKQLTDWWAYLIVFSSKHLHAHDGKNEPEYQANQQNVEDAGNGLHQGIDNNLKHKVDRIN